MMTPTGRIQTQHRPRRHLTRPLSLWQRLLLGGYSALLALGLPLICAGAAAEPGHPHPYPHFVFAEPLQHHAEQPLAHAAIRKMPTSSAHQRGSHAAMVHVAKSPATCPLHPTGAITGRATLALIVFSILLLLLLGEQAIRRLDWPLFALWRRLHFAQSLFLPVPLPPPRLQPTVAW